MTLPEKMLFTQIAVPKDLANALLKALQESGSFQPEGMHKAGPEVWGWIRDWVNRVDELNGLVERFESMLKEPLLVRIGDLELDAGRLEEWCVRLLRRLREDVGRTGNVKERAEALRSDLLSKEELLKDVEVLAGCEELAREPLVNLSFEGDALRAATLMIGKDGLTEAGEVLSKLKRYEDAIVRVVLPKEGREAAVVIAGVRWRVEPAIEALKRIGAREVKLPRSRDTLSSFLTKLRGEVEELRGRVKELEDEFIKAVKVVGKDVAIAKVVVRALRERLSAALNAYRGNYLMVIEGWVPASRFAWLKSNLTSRLKNVFVREVKTDREPPTKMRNPRAFRIYEMITKIYGVPNHREFDPTPIITYSLTIFFGLMFADVVYGTIMLIIVNWLLEKTGFVDNPYSEGYRTFKKLFTCLAASSIFFGFLSNSFAGYSIVFRNGSISFEAVSGPRQPAILPLMNPMFFIALALLIGLTHVNIAHALALAKALRLKDRGETVSKIGFFIAELFGIPYILHQYIHTPLPPPFSAIAPYLIYGAIGGVGILTAGKFITYRGLGAIFWLFDITGLLGDVMSYTRLAGIGLATSLLAQNFNSLAIGMGSGIAGAAHITGLLGLVLGGIISFLAMVFANMLNIAFGIIGAFVHSLRLCFVEFLPKFYDGDGREFRPMRIKVEKAVLLGGSPISM